MAKNQNGKMKIILLSILAVAMIGLMVPSAFAEQITIDALKNENGEYVFYSNLDTGIKYTLHNYEILEKHALTSIIKLTISVNIYELDLELHQELYPDLDAFFLVDSEDKIISWEKSRELECNQNNHKWSYLQLTYENYHADHTLCFEVKNRPSEYSLIYHEYQVAIEEDITQSMKIEYLDMTGMPHLLVQGLPTINLSSPELAPVETSIQKIPEWVKNVFTWYAQDQISEDELLNAIKFLVNQGIINLNE